MANGIALPAVGALASVAVGAEISIWQDDHATVLVIKNVLRTLRVRIETRGCCDRQDRFPSTGMCTAKARQAPPTVGLPSLRTTNSGLPVDDGMLATAKGAVLRRQPGSPENLWCCSVCHGFWRKFEDVALTSSWR
jgi:hypothetical protein